MTMSQIIYEIIADLVYFLIWLGQVVCVSYNKKKFQYDLKRTGDATFQVLLLLFNINN